MEYLSSAKHFSKQFPFNLHTNLKNYRLKDENIYALIT